MNATIHQLAESIQLCLGQGVNERRRVNNAEIPAPEPLREGLSENPCIIDKIPILLYAKGNCKCLTGFAFEAKIKRGGRLTK